MKSFSFDITLMGIFTMTEEDISMLRRAMVNPDSQDVFQMTMAEVYSKRGESEALRYAAVVAVHNASILGFRELKAIGQAKLSAPSMSVTPLKPEFSIAGGNHTAH